MQPAFHLVLAACLLIAACFGQSTQKEPQDNPLCLLQKSIREGEHETVRVSALFRVGPEHQVLDDDACAEESTWVELEVQSERNRKKLRKILDRTGKALVVVEGEFYGPPLPDPKLPENIRKAYHPRWGHLGCCRTKLVVHAIREVKTGPVEASDGGAGSNP